MKELLPPILKGFLDCLLCSDPYGVLKARQAKDIQVRKREWEEAAKA